MARPSEMWGPAGTLFTATVRKDRLSEWLGEELGQLSLLQPLNTEAYKINNRLKFLEIDLKA